MSKAYLITYRQFNADEIYTLRDKFHKNPFILELLIAK